MRRLSHLISIRVRQALGDRGRGSYEQRALEEVEDVAGGWIEHRTCHYSNLPSETARAGLHFVEA